MLFLFSSCGPTSYKEKIIGTWETFLDKEKEKAQLETLRALNRKIIMTFNSDHSLISQMVRRGEVLDSYVATYDFENDQKHLIVYREGKKDRKNVAEIVNLTNSVLTLVDITGTGDTLNLKKIR